MEMAVIERPKVCTLQLGCIVNNGIDQCCSVPAHPMGTAALENPCRRWIIHAERWIFHSVNAKDLCFFVRRSLYFTDLTRTYAITQVSISLAKIS
jgi:hypothetical protein